MTTDDTPTRDENDGDEEEELYRDSLLESLEQSEKEDRPPTLILAGAALGLVIGIFLWGSVALSTLSGVFGIFDDSSPSVSSSEEGSSGEDGDDPTTDPVQTEIDCDAFGPTRALSPEREAAFQAQCATATPEPAPEEPDTPTDTTVEREDCAAIRGTEYRSAAERQWFLDNCLN